MQNDREPNWDKWRHVPAAKIWEAVALSLNVEPGKVKHSSTSWMADVHMFNESKEFDERIFVAGRNVGTRKKLIPIAMVQGDTIDCEVGLREFAAWALSIEWVVPPKFGALAHASDDISAKAASSAAKQTSAVENPPGERERQSLLNIIGGLVDLMLRASPGGKPQSVFKSQAAIIESLLAHHPGKRGISKRNLEDQFSKAKRALESG